MVQRYARQTPTDEFRSDSGRWVFFVAFYSILANIPYWIASREFGLIRNGWFCLEYALVGLVALFVPRSVSAALLLTITFTDLIRGVCRTYSLSVWGFVTNAGVFHDLPGNRRHAAVAVVLLVLLTTVIAFLMPARPGSGRADQRLRAAMFLLAFALFLPVTDCVFIVLKTGQFPNPLSVAQRRDGIRLRWNSIPSLVRFPALRFIPNEIAMSRGLRAAELKPAASFPGAMAYADRAAGFTAGQIHGEPPNVVLVLVESWGLAADTSLRDSIVQPYLQPNLQARYEVMQGTVLFDGGTVAGESRELCGNALGGNLLEASRSALQNCLPARLATRGYHTIALHGMDGRMFSRSTWYGTIGFDERWFNGQFRKQGLPDCLGAFVGTCDASIAEWLGNRLEEPGAQPLFIHWVTLNSHLPVFVPSPLASGAPCTAAERLTPNSPLCSWYQLVAEVHQSVAEVAMGNLARPTVFVLVGDHAPPFSDPDLRDRFSGAAVPYVVLVPREEAQPAMRSVPRNALAHLAPAGRSSSSVQIR